MTELIAVNDEQLPVLLDWLEGYMPNSWKLYGMVREQLRGKWEGLTFLALVEKEWPNIVAVGEGLVDGDKCKCADYYFSPKLTAFFAADPGSAHTLLTWPGYLDWTKLFAFIGIPEACFHVVKELSDQYGGGGREYPGVLMKAEPGNVQPRPVPLDMTAGPLDPDLYSEYALSTWQYQRRNALDYVTEIIRRFPSVGLFDRDGNVVGFEIGNEMGCMSLLHVEEKHRNKGLGKTITSLLAQKYFSESLPASANVQEDNTPSLRLHESLGFTRVCRHVSFIHKGLELEEIPQVKDL